MSKEVRRVFLVDYENTSIRGLFGISCLGENCKIVVFCSTPTIQRSVEDVLSIYRERGVETGTFLLKKVGKNALDFMISTYLGYEINEAIDKEVYIISADHGFESAVEMAQQLDQRMKIGFRQNIAECLPGEMRRSLYAAKEHSKLMLTDQTAPVLLLESSGQYQSAAAREPEAEVIIEQIEKPVAEVLEKTAVLEQQSATVPSTTAESGSVRTVTAKKIPVKSIKVKQTVEVESAKEKKKQQQQPPAASETTTKQKETKLRPVQAIWEAVIQRKAEPSKKEEKKSQKKAATELTVASKELDKTKQQENMKPTVISEKQPESKKTEKPEKSGKPVKTAEPTPSKVDQRSQLMEWVKKDNKIPSKYQAHIVSAIIKETQRDECSQKIGKILGTANAALVPVAMGYFDRKNDVRVGTSKMQLTKNQRSTERVRLMELMKMENKIPEKYHNNLAAAMVNTTLRSECMEKVEQILGNSHRELISVAIGYFDHERK